RPAQDEIPYSSAINTLLDSGIRLPQTPPRINSGEVVDSLTSRIGRLSLENQPENTYESPRRTYSLGSPVRSPLSKTFDYYHTGDVRRLAIENNQSEAVGANTEDKQRFLTPSLDREDKKRGEKKEESTTKRFLNRFFK